MSSRPADEASWPLLLAVLLGCDVYLIQERKEEEKKVGRWIFYARVVIRTTRYGACFYTLDGWVYF